MVVCKDCKNLDKFSDPDKAVYVCNVIDDDLIMDFEIHQPHNCGKFVPKWGRG